MKRESVASISALSGIVLVDKPAGCTSHDVVSRVRRVMGTRRVGHAGTLDPMATGLLILGVGWPTRLLTYLVGLDKTYTATIRLGVATVTDDAEGDVISRAESAMVAAVIADAAALTAAVARLTGNISQVPSAVSAVKVAGRRSYERVRSGETVDLPARQVVVHRFAVVSRRPMVVAGQQILDLDVEVAVSSGTYVRALARDLGRDLRVGGHLVALRRTRIGPFPIAQAHSLDAVTQDPTLRTPAEIASSIFPVRTLSAHEAQALRHGVHIKATGMHVMHQSTSWQPGEAVAALDGDGSLVALLVDSGQRARSVLVVPEQANVQPPSG
ncbi:MAG: tRNA pseudouridine(55) synthase TruB [Actinomycetota bacterium]